MYIIGIDLGTTNCVLAYSLLGEDKPEVNLLPIPQLVAPDTTENRDSLPSFLYLSEDGKIVTGEFARRRSAEVPDRTISAAKSWLCYSKVDRRAPILPWNSPAEVSKLSPLTATQKYIEYLIKTWETAFPDAPITQQEVVLTVPASFDASARELTREAAIAAGLSAEKLTFLEEPQAAIYAWLEEVGDNWRKELKVGDTLLVCDIGGGTTDLTLVGVEQENGELILKRIAVGDHLLVGGDNMDLALAHHVAELLAEKGTKLDAWQAVSLWHSCRAAKESLLTPKTSKTGKDNTRESAADSFPISVLGRGTKLIGGTITVDVKREKVESLLTDGFFPQCELTDRPKRRAVSGFRELGLPFENDTGITRHLGAFLSSHNAKPAYILLNGGVFKAKALQERLFDTFENWFPNERPAQLESGAGLDNSVARGAVYYGWAKQKGGVRIRGGTARSYYIGFETAGLAIPGAPRPLKALCVAPFGMEEGTETDVPSEEIGLVVGEPAHFRFFSSTTRKEDKPGALLGSSHIAELDSNGVASDESASADIFETDSMVTVLEVSDVNGNTIDDYVPVKFHTSVTELGVMELWCNSTISDNRWKLEFSVREDAN
ncbi:MAG: Hsp70 family protein [Thermoguttaceae bacterium]